MRCSLSSLISSAASGAIGSLLNCRAAVNGARGRVSPPVAAGNRHAAVERSAIPVDARLDPLPAHLDGDASAMILGSLGGVQRGPHLGGVETEHLAAQPRAAVGD